MIFRFDMKNNIFLMYLRKRQTWNYLHYEDLYMSH